MATAPTRATIDDLYRVEGKAELIGGKVVELLASGLRPGEVASNIRGSLRGYARVNKRGVATGDGVGYAIPEIGSGRESFCPDAAYYNGPMPANTMRFIDGAPDFGVVDRRQRIARCRCRGSVGLRRA